MLTFIKTSPRGKSWTQIMKVADTDGDKSWNHEVSVKVADTNHESRRHKPPRHVKVFVTKSVTSPWQTRSLWFVSATFQAGKFRWKSQSWL